MRRTGIVDARPASALVDLLETFRTSADLFETNIDGSKKVGPQAGRAQFVPERRLFDVGLGCWADDEAWRVTRHASGVRKDGPERPPRVLRRRDAARDRPGADPALPSEHR